MFRRFLPLLIIAFVTGTLFRIGNQYGIPAFRMFGTWGIVMIGIWGSSILRGIQLEEGLKNLDERLKALSEKVRIERIGLAGRLPVWMLQTPRGNILLGASDVSHSARSHRANRVLSRHARAVIDAALSSGKLPQGEEPEAALVLLRRGLGGRRERLPLAEGRAPVLLVNPESLDEFVRAAGA